LATQAPKQNLINAIFLFSGEIEEPRSHPQTPRHASLSVFRHGQHAQQSEALQSIQANNKRLHCKHAAALIGSNKKEGFV
jgi:hypothetical protein